MLAKHIFSKAKPVSARCFGAMDQVNMKNFEHTFTDKIEFRDELD